jgi:serine protease
MLIIAIGSAHSQGVQSQNGQSQETNPVAAGGPAQSETADRIIIKWRDTAAKGSSASARAEKAGRLTGSSMSAKQSISASIDVMQLPAPLGGAALKNVVERLQTDGDVEYASPDMHRHIHAVTSDPLLTDQWYLLSAQPSATRTEQAWDITHGSASVVVAVLDTGVRFNHPDLGRISAAGKVLPGYDFVTNTAVANDGDGRDADPSDPGDWVTTAELQQPDFTKCKETPSSWHGTRVSGLIGALTDNGEGVAGAAWNTQVLPVRVLGKCGGFDSDIIAAMRWAAGLAVSGVPANPTPAKIINLSLGSAGVCSTAYQAAVNEITARGVLIVASAGNEGGPVDAPANCSGVLGVAGLRHVGSKVGFSSLGPEVGIGAPGGNCVNTGFGQPCLFSIVVATDTGTTTPVAPAFTDQINSNVGTSFSGPMAAATAALMTAVNSTLTPAQLISLIQRSATPFPPNDGIVPVCHVPTSATDLQTLECSCTTQTCGAGMLNTGAAVTAAIGPLAILQTSGTAVGGGSITLNGSSSFASNGRALSTFLWTVVDISGTAPVLTSPGQSTTTLSIPGAATFTVRLTVTDDLGGQDSEETTLTAQAPPPPPAAAQKSGGGGGTMGWELLGLSALLAGRRRRTTSPAAPRGIVP